MKTENIKQAFEDYAPAYEFIAGPIRKEKRYETLEDWICRLSHVDGRKVINELSKHDSISIFDLVSILYPKIVDDESAKAHGANSYQEYLALLARCKKYQQEAFIA